MWHENASGNGVKETRIGCSGYYYPSWKGKFYPTTLKPAQWLAHYSTVFNTVELNGTFYRMPQLSNLKKYHSVTPADFSFSVKASKYITHVLKLKDAKTYVNEFSELIENGLGEKFGKLLFQLPPSFNYSDENLERVCNSIPFSEKNVIEFRNSSWWNETVKKRLQEIGLNFCNVDFPGLEVPFMHTTKHFYLRLHGVPILFKSPYEKKELEAFAKQIPKDSLSTHIYFNNTYYDAAFLNAQTMMGILNKRKK